MSGATAWLWMMSSSSSSMQGPALLVLVQGPPALFPLAQALPVVLLLALLVREVRVVVTVVAAHHPLQEVEPPAAPLVLLPTARAAAVFHPSCSTRICAVL